MRRIAVALGIVLVVAGLGAAGSAVWARAERHPRVHGIDFSLKLSTDTNFCLEKESDGSVIVSACAARDDQHFTFTDSADGTNVVVGDGGDCLDRGNGRPGRLVTARPCTFGATQQFTFTRTGKLADPAVTVCVAAAQAAQDAQVFDDRCHISGGQPIETFVLSH